MATGDDQWTEGDRLDVNIYDDDPGLHFADMGEVGGDGILALRARENGRRIPLTIERQPPFDKPASVDVLTVAETATEGVDFEPFHQTVNFIPGETRRRVWIRSINDSVIEGPETFLVHLTNDVPDGQIGYPRTARVTIFEPGFHFEQASVNVWSGGPADIVVTRSGADLPAASVLVSTVPGTAQSPSNYLEVRTNLTFAAGEVSKPVSIPIIAGGGGGFGGAPQFRVRLSDASGTPIETISEAVVFINSLDPHESDDGFEIFSANYAVDIVRNRFTSGVAWVSYAVSGGTATDGKDFVGGTHTVTFAPGEVRKQIAVPLIDDNDVELLESFGISLVSSGGAPIGYNRQLSVYLQDDDTGYRVGELPEDYYHPIEVSESVGQIEIPVYRDGDFLKESSVDYEATNLGWFPGQTGSARPGIEFVAVHGTLKFGAGELRASFVLPVLDNPIVQGDREFFIRLSNAIGGAPIGSGQRTVVIHDNESGPSAVVVEPQFRPQLLEPTLPSNPNDRQFLARQSDAQILWVSQAWWQEGRPGVFLQRLLENGDADPTFHRPHIWPQLRAIVIQADDRILLVPEISNGETEFEIDGVPHQFLARLTRDGQPDSTFRVPFSAEGMPIQGVVPDIAGGILLVSGMDRSSFLFRIHNDGSWDSGFPLTHINGVLTRMYRGHDDIALLTGGFDLGQGQRRSRLAISAQGVLLPDTDFTWGSGPIFPQVNGGILAVSPSDALVRYRSDGSLDSGFHPHEFNSQWRKYIAETSTERIWCLYGQCGPTWLEGLRADGTQDSQTLLARIDVEPGCALIDAIMPTGDGGLVMAGNFTSINGTPASGLAKIRPMGVVGIFELAPETRRVPENIGRVELKLRRIGYSANAVGLTWRSEDGTAKAGRDYVAANGTVLFDKLETEKPLLIEILDNNVAERPRWFRLVLHRENPEVPDPPSLPVFIANDDLGVLADGISLLPDGRVRMEVQGLTPTWMNPHNVLESSNDLVHWTLSPLVAYPDWQSLDRVDATRVVFDDPGNATGSRFHRVRQR